MINPSEVNLSELPWLPLEAKSAFPRQSSIYFAIDSLGTVQYIGRSVDPKIRWAGHHRYIELQEIGSIKISYLFVDSPELLPAIESALIDWFDPPLNVAGKTSFTEKQGENRPPRSGGVKNRLREFVKERGISAYRLWKDTGLSRPTAYRACKDPDYPLAGEVLDKICTAYKIQPGEILYWVPKEEAATK